MAPLPIPHGAPREPRASLFVVISHIITNARVGLHFRLPLITNARVGLHFRLPPPHPRPLCHGSPFSRGIRSPGPRRARPVLGGSHPRHLPVDGETCSARPRRNPDPRSGRPRRPPRALGLRIPSTRGSRGRTWRVPSPQWSRPWRVPPPLEEGRVTRSQTRKGTARLVAPLEHDRPRRAPVSPIQRAKTRWTYLVDSGRVDDALYNNDWGCVVNTIPRGLQAQWIKVWIEVGSRLRRRDSAVGNATVVYLENLRLL